MNLISHRNGSYSAFSNHGVIALRYSMDWTKYFDSGWKSIVSSFEGWYSSANTRRSGSAKAVAVYSMRGVCPTRPQPHESLKRSRRLTRRLRIVSGTRPRMTSNPNAARVGDICPKEFGVRRETFRAN